jgi:soluble lytic murein transglycosylase-like protein
MAKPGYQEVIRAARMHQVPVDLALRVAKQESRGNCGAKSSAGALGVMQVMPGTGAKHGYSTKQLINCRTGAEAGVKELKHLLRLSGGDVKQTLTGYNCGEKCMFGRRKKLPLETVNYIQVVTGN